VFKNHSDDDEEYEPSRPIQPKAVAKDPPNKLQLSSDASLPIVGAVFESREVCRDILEKVFAQSGWSICALRSYEALNGGFTIYGHAGGKILKGEVLE